MQDDMLSPLLQVLCFFGLWVLAWLPLATPLAIALRWRPFSPLAPSQKIVLVLSLYALAPLLLWGATQVQQLSWADYGIVLQGRSLLSLGVGLGLGLGGIWVLMGLQVAWGWLKLERHHLGALFQAALPILGLALVISAVEEPIFRGFTTGSLQQAWGPGLGAIAASLLFALLHLVWDGGASLPQVPGLWLMGMVLVLARWVDHGSVALAVGLHAGWIWAIACVDTAKLLSPTGKGPGWVMGKDQQPLAGVLSWLLLGVTGLAITGLGLAGLGLEGWA